MAMTMKPKLIFVNKKPFRVWTHASAFKDEDLLLGFRPDLHMQLAMKLIEMLDQEGSDHAVLGLRLLYGLAQEAFFALLFSTLQAPDAPTAWLLLYQNRDLCELIRRFQEGVELPSRLVCPEPGSWEALAVMLFPESLMQEVASRARARRLGSFWAEWAQEQLDDDMRAEFNGLKHGTRIRTATPYLAVDHFPFEGEAHGSVFATCESSYSDVVLGICARSWSGRTLYSRLKLMAASSSNLVGFLRLIHRAGDTSNITIELPDDDELDSAKPSGKPLIGLRLGPSWEKNRVCTPLTYEEAIIEYRKGSGTPRFGGNLA